MARLLGLLYFMTVLLLFIFTLFSLVYSVVVLFYSCYSHVQVLKTTLMHELNNFYSHTK